jgi:polyisoprenyl-teichoic acid--peptidoglycan teichoic acid transferase
VTTPEHRGSRRRRTWGQRLVITTGVLSAVLLAGAAAGLGYLYRKVDRLPRMELSGVLAASDEGGEAKNYLIVGVDDATGLDPDDAVWRGREAQNLSDTIMVLRVDPEERKAVLLSLPRDLWVTFPDGDEARINAAIQKGEGRPDVLIELLDSYLGIPVHHYVQLNFAGFRDLVDAIDGVPVHFSLPSRDRYSGLAVAETGCVTLDPDQALAYARSRHFQQLVGEEWESDPTGDLGRIQRQQAFIRAALDRAVSKGARNPGTLDRLLDVGLDSVAVDDELTTGDILDLAQRFRSFDPGSLETISVPVVEDTTSGGAQIVRLVESEAEAVLAQFRGESGGSGGSGDGGDGGAGGDDDALGGEDDNAAELVDPVSVRLSVLNGSGVSGQARDAADELGKAGFTVVGTGEADSFGYEQTTVRYPAGSRAEAETVQRWLAAGAVLEEVPAADDGSAAIEVVTGADWTGVAARPGPPASSTTGTDAAADNAGSTGSSETSSTPATEADDSATPTSDSTTTTTIPSC